VGVSYVVPSTLWWVSLIRLPVIIYPPLWYEMETVELSVLMLQTVIQSVRLMTVRARRRIMSGSIVLAITPVN